MTTLTKDDPNIFKNVDYDEDYWNDYLAARPEYDQAFYQSIYDFHTSHNGQTESAHDIGTGPGQVAAELAGHFNHVIASDVNATHLAVAEHRLNPLVSSKRLSLASCSAEELAETFPPSSADLIVAAECLPLMDARKALQAFATVLRPNGTLAIWFYGRPIFAEPEYAAECQPLLDSILDLSFAPIIKGGRPQQKTAWKRATDRMASFLDDVELGSDVWRNVERRKWNADRPMPFYGPDACDFEITRTSAAGKQEVVVEKKDLGIWERRWDLDGVKRFVAVNLPAFDNRKQDPLVEDKYRELERAFGGEISVRKITWPVVLILATKTAVLKIEGEG